MILFYKPEPLGIILSFFPNVAVNVCVPSSFYLPENGNQRQMAHLEQMPSSLKCEPKKSDL